MIHVKYQYYWRILSHWYFFEPISLSYQYRAAKRIHLCQLQLLPNGGHHSPWSIIFIGFQRRYISLSVADPDVDEIADIKRNDIF